MLTSTTYPAGAAPVRLNDLTDLMLLTDITGSREPRELYDRLEREWGVVAPIELERGVPAWIVLGHREICDVLRNERLFSARSSIWRGHAEGRLSPASPLTPFLVPQDRSAVYAQDGTSRERLRGPIDDAVAALDEFEVGSRVRRRCLELVEHLAPRGNADLVADYAVLVPILSVADILGWDPVSSRHLLRLMRQVVAGGEQSQTGGPELVALVGEQIANRRAAPRHDLTSLLTHHPAHRNAEEVANAVMLLAGAAHGYLVSWISQAILLMLTDGGLSGKVTGGRLSLDEALDHVLWHEAPSTHVMPRYATRDMEFGGKLVARGDAVVLALHAANTDPRVHTGDPWDEIGNRAHLSFGTGPHACPATGTARIIARIAVETVLQQLQPRLAGTADDITWDDSPWTRRPTALPVEFLPRATGR